MISSSSYFEFFLVDIDRTDGSSGIVKEKPPPAFEAGMLVWLSFFLIGGFMALEGVKTGSSTF